MLSVRGVVSSGLDNRHSEANYPLINFAKLVGIDVMLNHALGLSLCNEFNRFFKEHFQHNQNRVIEVLACFTIQPELVLDKFLLIQEGQYRGLAEPLKNYLLALEPKTRHRIRDAFLKLMIIEHPIKSNSLLNFGEDQFSKLVMDSYLQSPKNKAELVEKLMKWTIDHLMDKVRSKIKTEFESEAISSAWELIEPVLMSAIYHVHDADFVKECLEYILSFNIVKTNPVFRQLMVDEFFIKNNLRENLNQFFTKNISDLCRQFQEDIHFRLLYNIKRQQSYFIYQYDAICEERAPYLLRGLHGVDKNIVIKIALVGDIGEYHNLFNNGISTMMRQSHYALGHTENSNRSGTIKGHIAVFFATDFAFKRSNPELMWVLIYDAQKAVNTTQYLVKGKWNELEFVTAGLKSKRFLGAVQLKCDPLQTDQHQIRLVAVDGFCTDTVLRSNQFLKEINVADEAEHFLKIAIKFEQANQKGQVQLLEEYIENKPKEFEYILPCHRIDHFITSKQSEHDYRGIDKNNYLEKRKQDKVKSKRDGHNYGCK